MLISCLLAPTPYPLHIAYLVLEEQRVEVGWQRRLVWHEPVARDEREEVRVVRVEEGVRLAY